MLSFAFVEGLGLDWFVLRSFSQFGGDGYFVDVFAQELLNVLEAALVIKADEGDGAALGAGAGGTSYAVYVILRVLRNVIVDDKVYIVDVNSA